MIVSIILFMSCYLSTCLPSLTLREISKHWDLEQRRYTTVSSKVLGSVFPRLKTLTLSKAICLRWWYNCAEPCKCLWIHLPMIYIYIEREREIDIDMYTFLNICVYKPVSVNIQECRRGRSNISCHCECTEISVSANFCRSWGLSQNNVWKLLP